MKTLIPALALLVSAVHAEIVTLAHPDEALPEKSTVVWSPLYQATWDKLDADPHGPPGKEKKLESFKWDADKVMPESSRKTWIGPATDSFLKQVNSEAAAITGEKASAFRLAAEDPAHRVAFGLLDRDMEFQGVFVRSRKAPLDFQAGELTQPVHFFGIRYVMSQALSDTARVLAYRPVDHSHALQIPGKEAGESVILYLPAKPQDFATACAWLRTWRSQSKPDKARSGAWNDPSLHIEDEIRIPSIDLESKLGGIRHLAGEPGSLIHVGQFIRFQLHEKAAHIPNEVLTEGVDPFAEPPPSAPRKFIYDRPFFAFLWRDGAEWPYFGAWIGDASALKAFP